ncbi:MAG: hypothetical protein AAGJ40_04320 [Planctomycetota bacterium]
MASQRPTSGRTSMHATLDASRKVKTTADVRAISDMPLPRYVCSYGLLYVAAIVVLVAFDNAFTPDDLNGEGVFGTAAMVAHIATQRQSAPRFRSLTRFAIAAIIAASSAAISWWVVVTHASADIEFASAIGHASFATFIGGAIDAVRFVAACLFTPGR